jgi:lysophospholipase L1-like esterase
MANWAVLKAAIADVIKTNDNQEITGAALQSTLLAMINSLGSNYQFVGIAETNTNPGTPDQNVFYLAGEGTYINFSNLTIDIGQIGVLKWDGSWSKQVLEVGSGGGNMILDWNTDIATTRKQVLAKYRKPGIQISYKEPQEGWINEQYIGTLITDVEWVKNNNWKQIPNQKSLLEIDKKILRLEFVSSQNLLILNGGNLAPSNDENLFLYIYRIVSDGNVNSSLVLSNLISDINVSYGAFCSYAIYNSENINRGSLISIGERINNGATYISDNDIIEIDKTAKILCVAGTIDGPLVSLFNKNSLESLQGLNEKYSDNILKSKVLKIIDKTKFFNTYLKNDSFIAPDKYTLSAIISTSALSGGEIFSIGNISISRVNYLPSLNVTIADNSELIEIPAYMHYYKLDVSFNGNDAKLKIYINGVLKKEIDTSEFSVDPNNLNIFKTENNIGINVVRMYNVCLSDDEIFNDDLYNLTSLPTLFWLCVSDIDVNKRNALGGYFSFGGSSSQTLKEIDLTNSYEIQFNSLFNWKSDIPEFTTNDRNFLRIISGQIPICGFKRVYIDSKLTHPSSTTGIYMEFTLLNREVVKIEDDLSAKWVDVPKNSVSVKVAINYNGGLFLGEAESISDFNEKNKISNLVYNNFITNFGYKSCLILGDSWSDSVAGLKPWVSILSSILNIENSNICCVAKSGRQCKSVQGSQYTGHPLTGGQTGYVAINGTENCDLQNQVLLVKRLYEGDKQESESIIFNEDLQPDVCIIAIGTNDAVDENNSYEFIENQIMTNQSTSVGYVPKPLDEVDCTNFAGAIYFAAQTLYDLFPKTLVVYCLPPQTNLNNKDQRDKGLQIERVCNRLGIPTINWYSGCGFTTLTCPIINQDGNYKVRGDGDMSSDGLHPSTQGYYKLGNYTAKKIMSINPFSGIK